MLCLGEREFNKRKFRGKMNKTRGFSTHFKPDIIIPVFNSSNSSCGSHDIYHTAWELEIIGCDSFSHRPEINFPKILSFPEINIRSYLSKKELVRG